MIIVQCSVVWRDKAKKEGNRCEEEELQWLIVYSDQMVIQFNRHRVTITIVTIVVIIVVTQALIINICNHGSEEV